MSVLVEKINKLCGDNNGSSNKNQDMNTSLKPSYRKGEPSGVYECLKNLLFLSFALLFSFRYNGPRLVLFLPRAFCRAVLISMYRPYSPDISSVQAVLGSKFFALRKSKLYLLQKYAKKMAPYGLSLGEHFGYCKTVMFSV